MHNKQRNFISALPVETEMTEVTDENIANNTAPWDNMTVTVLYYSPKRIILAIITGFLVFIALAIIM